MDLYLLGADQNVYRRYLLEQHVDHVAVNYWEWRQRQKTDDVFKIIPPEIKVCITAGVAKKAAVDWVDFARDYYEFCERNAEECLIYDLDAPNCPSKIRLATRRQLSLLPNTVLFPYGDEDPADIARDHDRVGLNANWSKKLSVMEMRRIRAKLYGSNVLNLNTLRQARFQATTTLGWMSARRFGELLVFTGGKLKHYPADQLQRAVRVHRQDIESLGTDPAACAANDKGALTALAVQSLLVAADSVSKRLRDREVTGASSNEDENETSTNGNKQPVASSEVETYGAPIERMRQMLPVLIEDPTAPGQTLSSPLSLRQCDTCYLASSCPQCDPGSACAFAFPVSIATKEDKEHCARVLLEFQFNRSSFAYFSEQVDGQGVQPRTGQEFDRFFKMLTQLKEVEEEPVQPEGVLKAIFGDLLNRQPQLVEGEAFDDEEDPDEEDATIVEEGEYEDLVDFGSPNRREPIDPSSAH